MRRQEHTPRARFIPLGICLSVLLALCTGFVMGTLLMRLSFSAEHPLDIAVSLFATLYVLALTYAVNRFPPSLLHNVSEDGDDKPEP